MENNGVTTHSYIPRLLEGPPTSPALTRSSRGSHMEVIWDLGQQKYGSDVGFAVKTTRELFR
jgi:hypothetical protein